jgi:hypothetical protein
VKRATAAAALAASLAACSGEAPPPRGPPAWSSGARGAVGVTSGLPAEQWFPLVDGNVYQYRTSDDEGPGGLLVARVHRASASVGELRTPSGTRRFTYRPDGLATLNKDGVWALVFRLPIEQGPTWRGEHGGMARWDALDVEVEVPAGRYRGCARVLEEQRGDRPARFVTTFCPDVGVVLLDAAGGGALERAELAYVGPPFELGPEGVRRVP